MLSDDLDDVEFYENLIYVLAGGDPTKRQAIESLDLYKAMEWVFILKPEIKRE